MKKIMSLLVLALCILFTACKKSNTTSINNNNNTNTTWNWSGTAPMSCKVNGVAWQCASGDEDYMDNGSFMAFYGISGQKEINLNIPMNAAVGAEYTITGINLNSMALVADNASGDSYDTFSSSVGKVKILENDATHCKALFYFDAKNQDITKSDKLTITEGFFNINK